MRAKRKTAVLLVRPASDFDPRAIGDIPGEILSTRVDRRGLTYCQALQIVRQHNTTKISGGRPIDTWAIVATSIRPLTTAGGAA